MTDKKLFTPGPTEVPRDILKAISRKVMHHRKEEFSIIYASTIEKLREVFRSEGEVFVFASSGTGAMEASVVNFTSRGDRALVIVGGKFGQRWAQLCEAFGVDAEIIEVPWGEAVDPGRVKEVIESNPDIKVVFSTLLETSTAVLHPIKEISALLKDTGIIHIVDAVSGLACEKLEMDKWGVDVVVSASHKALMNPPGIGLMCVSAEAKEAYRKNKRKSYYWDLRKASESLLKLQTPYTPPVNLIYGIEEALNKMASEGMENIWKRHRKLAGIARDSLKDMGFEFFSKSPASGLTAVKVPEGIDCKKMLGILENDYGYVMAGGQASLKGKIIRIAHMGCCFEKDLNKALKAIEKVKKNLES
ncbi:MAG: pyridoxal-phosphate-dependent aminotransferase family protein [Elusimicrobiota bacterium]